MEVYDNIKKQLNYIRSNLTTFYKSPESFLNILLENSNISDKKVIEIVEDILLNKKFDSASLDRLLYELSCALHENNFSRQSSKEILDIKLNTLFKSGSKTIASIEKYGLLTVSDILFHFPFRYEYLGNSSDNDKIILSGIYKGHKIIKSRSGRILVCTFSDSFSFFYGVWFNFTDKYPLPALNIGSKHYLYGKKSLFDRVIAIFHPEILKDEHLNVVRPVYSIPIDVKYGYFKKILDTIVNSYKDYIAESLPYKILKKYSFPSISSAVGMLHSPVNFHEAKMIEMRQSSNLIRFVYEELFYIQMGLLIKKEGYKKLQGISFEIKMEYLEGIKELIPFSLTKAQKKALSEIFNDMKSHNQMNRLLQGDVGSGKTIVSFIAGAVAVKNGFQCAIIAPTEVLAEQHFINIQKFAKNRFSSVMLTGSMTEKEKNFTKLLIENGNVDFIIGTHAIIQEDVRFYKLGFAVIDEQHRFGVMQRKSLGDKGYNPDILLMSATPIPRTLSLTFYGDLDLSIIDELPPGRKVITTKLYSDRKINIVYDFIQNELNKNNKIYFVYPLIDESEKLELKAAAKSYEDICNRFGKEHVGLMHGRLKAEEKRAMMDEFKNGNISILVSTTVIEVGVDVPEASVMVIENAERFGISQLHQLRGRVGRSDRDSFCFLIYSDKVSEDGEKRLKALEKYSDGFKLSEVDLEIRGPGDFFGVRQSGLPEMRYSNIVRDASILVNARTDAEETLRDDPFLEKSENYIIKNTLLDRWADKLDLINIG